RARSNRFISAERAIALTPEISGREGAFVGFEPVQQLPKTCWSCLQRISVGCQTNGGSRRPSERDEGSLTAWRHRTINGEKDRLACKEGKSPDEHAVEA